MPKRFKTKPYIRYSNVYEDVNSLILQANQGIYLSIASGFDNTLALLKCNPQKIVAFDYNEAQINLDKLKMSAFLHLSYQELLSFFGINSKKKERLTLYYKLRENLEEDVKTYFDFNLEIIKVGLVNAGRFEYYLGLFKKYVLPYTHNKKIINRFMNAQTIEEQREIYKEFDNKRFKKLFKIFFSQKVMAKLGREKAYFKYIEEDLATSLKKRVDLGFNNVLNRTNPYMQYVVLGKFNTLPDYLKEENYEIIKSNLHKIELVCADFKEAIKMYKYDFLNLSDIFEYMNEDETLLCEELIANNTNENARVVFWNMMVPRKFNTNNFKLLNSDNAFINERPFFYQKLYWYEKV